MTYRDELQKMFDLQKFGMKFGLDGLRNILKKLGDPHRGRKFIHLAGTNGKGSVGVMLESVLRASGRRVGLYTSPHLITFRERVTIAGEMITEADVLALSARVWEAVDPAAPPTFFEFVTALAFLYFKEKGCDLAVIEAGLGGRLDSTNVIENPLATVITNISLEHTEHLGHTLAAIAAEKAGIIKTGAPLICGRLEEEALAVILKTAADKSSPVALLGRDFKARGLTQDAFGRPEIDFHDGRWDLKKVKLGLAGPHQVDNAAVALAVLSQTPGLEVREQQIRQGLRETVWPGRGEIRPAGSWPPVGPPAKTTLMLDGAHNPAGAKALAAFLAGLDYRRLHLVVGVMADKDIAGVLGPVYGLADRLYLTRPEFSRAASPELLLEKISQAFGQPAVPLTLHPHLPGALEAAAAEAAAGDLVLLSGSLFTVGEGRAYLEGFKEVESN